MWLDDEELLDSRVFGSQRTEDSLGRLGPHEGSGSEGPNALTRTWPWPIAMLGLVAVAMLRFRDRGVVQFLGIFLAS